MSRVVILAWGNPSRGDDGLGPALAVRMESVPARGGHDVRVETDFQLQPEHAIDLVGCDVAIFVDADLDAAEPFAFRRVTPSRDRTFTSHAMSPAAVLAAYRDAFGTEPPPAYMLAIRGEAFALGTGLSAGATFRLGAACAFLERILAMPDIDGRAPPPAPVSTAVAAR
jgi:hydrogenase maturation protease